MTDYSVFAIIVIVVAAWLSRQVRKATEAALAEREEKQRHERLHTKRRSP